MQVSEPIVRFSIRGRKCWGRYYPKRRVSSIFANVIWNECYGSMLVHHWLLFTNALILTELHELIFHWATEVLNGNNWGHSAHYKRDWCIMATREIGNHLLGSDCNMY